MKTERLNLLVSPKDKAEIAARASALNLSTSELIRRAVAAYDPAHDQAEIEALAREFLETVARAEQALDAAIGRLDRLEENLERGRNEIRDQVFAAGDEWPFSVWSPIGPDK